MMMMMMMIMMYVRWVVQCDDMTRGSIVVSRKQNSATIDRPQCCQTAVFSSTVVIFTIHSLLGDTATGKIIVDDIVLMWKH